MHSTGILHRCRGNTKVQTLQSSDMPAAQGVGKHPGTNNTAHTCHTRHGNLLPARHFLGKASYHKVAGEIVGITVILLQDATPLPSWDEMNSCQAHPHAEDNSNWDPIKNGFYTIARIPNIMEAIDCTHITLRPPAGKEYLFQEPQGIPFNERSDHLLCHHAHEKCAPWIPWLRHGIHPAAVAGP